MERLKRNDGPLPYVNTWCTGLLFLCTVSPQKIVELIIMKHFTYLVWAAWSEEDTKRHRYSIIHIKCLAFTANTMTTTHFWKHGKGTVSTMRHFDCLCKYINSGWCHRWSAPTYPTPNHHRAFLLLFPFRWSNQASSYMVVDEPTISNLYYRWKSLIVMTVWKKQKNTRALVKWA